MCWFLGVPTWKMKEVLWRSNSAEKGNQLHRIWRHGFRLGRVTRAETGMRLASPANGTAHVGAWVPWASKEQYDWTVFTAPALNSFLSVMVFKLGNDMTKFLFSNLPFLLLVECGLWTTARKDIRGPVWVGLGKEDCIYICGSWWGCTLVLAWVSSFFWKGTFAAEGWCLAKSEASVRNYLWVQRRSDKSPDWTIVWGERSGLEWCLRLEKNNSQAAPQGSFVVRGSLISLCRDQLEVGQAPIQPWFSQPEEWKLSWKE